MKIAGSGRKYLSSEYCRLIVLGARVAQWVTSLDLTTHASPSPIRRGFAPGFVNYKKGCTRLAATSDKVYQLLAHGRWFSPASSTTKTGRHDIAEILLKVALKHQKSINLMVLFWGERRQKLTIVWSSTVNVYKRAMIMIVKHFLYTTCKSVRGSYNPASRVWFYQLQIFETNMWLYFGAFKFLRNRLFMMSMQLPRKRDAPSSAISKMSRSYSLNVILSLLWKL